MVISQFENDINTINPVVSFEDFLCSSLQQANPPSALTSQLEAGEDYAQIRVNGRHMWITLT